MKQKRSPLRKCTGCQSMKDKKELIRIVKNNTNNFCLDTTSKKPGRGAYVCLNTECIEKAQKYKGLERSFKCFVPKNIYISLKDELNSIMEGKTNG